VERLVSDLWHCEDYSEGQVVDLGEYHVSKDELLDFAREFDPQPFHLDEAAAQASPLGGLATSGWHSCAILMRMMCDSYLNRSAGLGSGGLSEIKWLRPVRPGETLTGKMTVVSRRVSAKRPDLGILNCRWELRGPDDELKMEVSGINFVRVRQP
jgi:acyl dehydratase